MIFEAYLCKKIIQMLLQPTLKYAETLFFAQSSSDKIRLGGDKIR